MEPPSGLAHREALLWLELLLTASLLTFWNAPTTAQEVLDFPVESVPPNAAEGKEVLLLPHKLPEKFLHLDWFIGELLPTNNIGTLRTNPENIIYGPAHSGRETLYSNGSLMIRNLSTGDTGPYYIHVITMSSDIFMERLSSVSMSKWFSPLSEPPTPQ